MDNAKLREAYDALMSGMLDTSDIEPYMHTITEALQIAGVKLEYLEQEAMVGKMEMATGIKVRLQMGLSQEEILKYIDSVLAEYKQWFKEHRIGVLKDG